jgi:hypothetical protein
MVMRLAPEEPEASPWRAERLTVVIEALTPLGTAGPGTDCPVILAVDGRSNSGKTTLAARIGEAVAGSAVVHTDDIAWGHSRFGWADLLIDGILTPLRQGGAVAFRPPRWADRGREGRIPVPAGCPLLVVEGVGAGRKEAAHLIDALIWVQSDEGEAERRNLALVGQPGKSPTIWHAQEWMAEERPFVAADRAWERADIVVSGFPQLSYDPVTGIVVAPPPPTIAGFSPAHDR